MNLKEKTTLPISLLERTTSRKRVILIFDKAIYRGILVEFERLAYLFRSKEIVVEAIEFYY